ncbi:MAG: ribulose-phosphate 3-epimerase [Rickettsiaceae bacterium]
MTIIAPSILSANFVDLKQEIQHLEAAGADMLHLDVMDGHFVPNLTFGVDVIRAIKDHTTLPLDVHLMIEQPELWIEQYHLAGATNITIHPESTTHLDRTISKIKQLGCKAGVALLPTTPVNILEYILEKIDLILVMTVNPGFGGQSFISNQVKKILQLAKIVDTNNTLLAVDGGINDKTAKLCIDAGANMLISGNYIFSGNYRRNITALRHPIIT